MWYLITYTPHSFAEIDITAGATNFEKETSDTVIPEYRVSQRPKYFEINVYEERTEAYWLNALNEINPEGFVLLNLTTVLLRWDSETEELIEHLKKIAPTRDKYAVFPVTEMLESNFLDSGFMRILFKQNK